MYFQLLHSFTKFPKIESCKKVFAPFKIMNIFQSGYSRYMLKLHRPDKHRDFVKYLLFVNNPTRKVVRRMLGLRFRHNVFTSDHGDFLGMKFSGGKINGCVFTRHYA